MRKNKKFKKKIRGWEIEKYCGKAIFEGIDCTDCHEGLEDIMSNVVTIYFIKKNKRAEYRYVTLELRENFDKLIDEAIDAIERKQKNET